MHTACIDLDLDQVRLGLKGKQAPMTRKQAMHLIEMNMYFI